jgi:hypothetical protein
MKKIAIFITACAILGNNSAFAATNNVGKGAGYGARNATVLSMMGWGVGLAVGIAALCALIPNSTTPSSTSH